MKKIATIAIETMFMLTLFAAGWFALVAFQGLTDSISCVIVRYNQERLRYELRQCHRCYEEETGSR